MKRDNGCPIMVVHVLRCVLTVAILCGLSLGIAQAEFLSPDLVTITMTDAHGHSASKGIANPFEKLPPQANVPERVQERIAERFELKHGNTVLGWVDSLGVDLDGDPVAGINFSLTAGGSDVTVTVTSATVAFAALMNPAASAEAEVTLTDLGGGGATISTLSGNSGLFKAIYNGTQEYGSLLSTSAVGGGSVNFSQDISGPIAGSVSSIQAQFAFKLTAGDSAQGSGTFTVVPEPTLIGLALCGCLTLLVTRKGRISA